MRVVLYDLQMCLESLLIVSIIKSYGQLHFIKTFDKLFFEKMVFDELGFDELAFDDLAWHHQKKTSV